MGSSPIIGRLQRSIIGGLATEMISLTTASPAGTGEAVGYIDEWKLFQNLFPHNFTAKHLS
jgi:hypothetical protein